MLQAEQNLKEIMKKEQVIKSNLTEDEVRALRLYTTAAYFPINDFLRNVKSNPNLKKSEETWATTIKNIYKAFVKLINNGYENKKKFLWRGCGGQLPPDFFVPDSLGVIQITEYGFLSTTTNEPVKNRFKDKELFNLTIKIIQYDKNIVGYHRGVDINWCSVIPSENEVLFPPLTFMEVVHREKRGKEIYLEVVPYFDL